MKVESTLSKMISTAGEKAAYDNACKRLLANKIILAWIMKSCLEEFGIKMTQELEREVSEMCNLSDGVEQKGIAKGIAKGITRGIIISIQNLMESMGWSIEQAMDALQIPTEERNGYLNMLKK